MSISQRLFVSLVSMLLPAVALLLVAVQYSMQSDIGHYWAEADKDQLEAALPVVASFYEQDEGWGRVLRMMRPPPPGMMPLPEGMPRFPPEIMGLMPRLTLLDAQGHVLLGHMPRHEGLNWLRQPIRAHDQVVGWLLLRPQPPIPATSVGLYLKHQRMHLLLLGMLTLLLSAWVAWRIARHFMTPVHALQVGHHALKQGQLDLRLPVDPKHELHQLLMDFNSLAETLQKNEVQRRSYVADIAHELRTPLAVLRAQLEAVQDGVSDFDDRMLGLLHEQVLQLTHLVADLQELAMADAGAQHYNRTQVAVDDLLRETGESFTEALQERQITVQMQLGLSGVQMWLDAQKMQQVIANILSNCRRYTETQGQLRMISRRLPQGVRLVIEDSGPGVPPWALPRLFDRFFRLEKSRARVAGGTGLGLSICKAVVEAQGGTIRAETSTLGGLAIIMEFDTTMQHKTL
ncbi:MAG: HAMP domain-containing protein [Pseudomonadales bacterium]|nr:HAMP domain-containing protein [Pseudomonadales bacterium]